MSIDSEALERAERVLHVVYTVGLEAQFEKMRVDRSAFDKFVAGVMKTFRDRYPDIDPRVEPGFNTCMAHAFLVGVVAGRNSERTIE